MRFESSLYFANVERFRKSLVAVTGKDPSVKEEERKEVKLANGSNEGPQRRKNVQQREITYSGVILKKYLLTNIFNTKIEKL